MKNKKLPSLVILMILSLITGMFWIVFNVYRVFTTKPAPAVPEEVIMQLDPKLDTDTINEMRNRLYP